MEVPYINGRPDPLYCSTDGGTTTPPPSGLSVLAKILENSVALEEGGSDGLVCDGDTMTTEVHQQSTDDVIVTSGGGNSINNMFSNSTCLLYTSDAADEEDSVDLGGRRIIKKKKIRNDANLIVSSKRT
eukprot:TRINITY_DN8053_c0_g1_i1.p1 TRINITY_DN8053_c0_g1~~TRINITY_DN8053_c0_g1_i1.p1  ORF type:complete len:129 (+),score=29.88 TRINITY_DN8053_c0_g1_i1:212-598(+)